MNRRQFHLNNAEVYLEKAAQSVPDVSARFVNLANAHTFLASQLPQSPPPMKVMHCLMNHHQHLEHPHKNETTGELVWCPGEIQ